MELENHTAFHAALFRGRIDDDRLFGSLVVRVTYDLRGDRLTLAEEQSWPVSPGPWKSPCGPLEGDELFYRGGVDLFVFGSARATDGKPATCVDVSVEIGRDFKSSLRVFGDRHWELRGRSLLPTPPRPFDAMPLTLENAYGGKDLWDELAIPFPSNPEGKGYVVSEESAPGKPLPNIEHPEHLIERWQDQPEPVGVCPCPPNCGPRVLGRVVFDERTGALRELKPTLFNHAFPRMIAPFLEPGEEVRVTGVRPGPPLEFTLPAPPGSARVKIGEHADVSPPPIDQVGIDVERSQVWLSYRYSFRYVMTPLQRRSCELLPSTGSGRRAVA
jgi:hypothetical protein